MIQSGVQEFPCDLCGNTEAVEVPHSQEYTDGQPVHICINCGFVYVKLRRSSTSIADTWSEEIFGSNYTAVIPAVKARQIFVAEFINNHLGLLGKNVFDVGAGEGQFLNIIRHEHFGAEVFGLESSANNVRRLRELDIECFRGTIEEYDQNHVTIERPADIVTIMWTLENCQSCRNMLAGAHRMLRDDGHIVVATGSRILVPFKKPLYDYFSKNPADTHAFRFSANTLQGILAVSGFELKYVNRYLDSDVLCAIAQKRASEAEIPWRGDNYLDVYSFFERWHVDTQMYYVA